VLGAWTLCREDGIAIQRAEDGKVGVNTLREHATSVQARRNSHHLLPSLPLLSSLPSSASFAHLRHAPLGTSAGSSIIDADLCPTHHRGPSIASVQCQPP
jgi:hypothetical protein